MNREEARMKGRHRVKPLVEGTVEDSFLGEKQVELVVSVVMTLPRRADPMRVGEEIAEAVILRFPEAAVAFYEQLKLPV